jgi:hypothetical protein
MAATSGPMPTTCTAGAGPSPKPSPASGRGLEKRGQSGISRHRAERQAAYRARFRQPLDAAFVATLGTASNGGWALGDERFRNEIAEALGRRVAPLPPGRPRRKRGDQ